jgi:hypothetical protein
VRHTLLLGVDDAFDLVPKSALPTIAALALLAMSEQQLANTKRTGNRMKTQALGLQPKLLHF